MSTPSSSLDALAEARKLADSIAASLPKNVDAASLTLKSKVPFKVLSLRELLIHRVSALASPAVVLFEEGKSVPAVVLTRSVLETVAIVFALHKQLRSFLKTKDVRVLDDFLVSCLLASRWDDATHPARSILAFVDYVDKKIPGFRSMYDSLSEYAHPNWCGVLGSFGNLDHESHILMLGSNQRVNAFKSGVSALSASLLTMQHFYNDMIEILHQLNEHFENQDIQ